MDGIAHIAKQQQTQFNTSSSQTHANTRALQENQHTQSATATKKLDIIKQMQNDSLDSKQQTDSQNQLKRLVDELNDTLSPFNTTIKFGVDSQDVFYVSVVDTKTHKVIRRFPAEEAQKILPKMQEVKGILFDSKG